MRERSDCLASLLFAAVVLIVYSPLQVQGVGCVTREYFRVCDASEVISKAKDQPWPISHEDDEGTDVC